MGPARPRRRGLGRREMWAGLSFVSPWLIGLGVFMLYPVIASLYFSFCDYSVLESAHPIGVANYVDLFHDELYLKSLGNTLFYAALSIPLGLVLALALALLLNTGVRGLTVYRTIFFLPALMPMVALAVLWLWIFNGEYGVLNVFLAKLHITAPGWLPRATLTPLNLPSFTSTRSKHGMGQLKHPSLPAWYSCTFRGPTSSTHPGRMPAW